MAISGPPPKDPSVRARRNKETVTPTTIKFVKGEQPQLPEGIEWPDRTREWWQTWAKSPLAEHFMDVDWQVLLDAALLHANVWGPKASLTHLAKLIAIEKDFGATFTARLQLRIQAAVADETDSRRGAPSQTEGAEQPKPGNDPRRALRVV